MLNKVTFGLMTMAGLGLYAGLDKLVNVFLLLLLLLMIKLYNSLIIEIGSENSKIVAFLRSHDLTRPVQLVSVMANLAGMFVCSVLLLQIYRMLLGANLSGYESLERLLLYITANIGLFFYCVFALRVMQESSASLVAPDVVWYRGVSYFAIAHVLIFSAMLILGLFSEADVEALLIVVDFGFFLGFVVIALITAEVFAGFLRNLVFLVRQQAHDTILPVSFFVSFFASEDSFKNSLVKSIEAISGVDVSRSEIVAFCIRISEPVCVVAIISIWLLTSLVVVGPTQEAIFTRLGTIHSGKAFGPGMYLKLPWPFTSVELFDSYQVRTLNIGFEPDPEQRHIIWTKTHAVKYFDLIVGDGVEIIAIDCQVMYRINDLFRFVTSMANPEEFISATTYKLLTEETVSARFDDIIARDRNVLAAHVKQELQKAVDDHDLGTEIVEVVFIAMHPPLEVADDFEDVISSQIDRLTYVLKANTENSYKLSMNQALARGKELEAESYAATNVAKASGEASSFLSRTLGYEYDPELTRFRLRYQMMQKVLEGKTLYIYDQSLMRKQDKLFIDINDQGR